MWTPPNVWVTSTIDLRLAGIKFFDKKKGEGYGETKPVKGFLIFSLTPSPLLFATDVM